MSEFLSYIVGEPMPYSAPAQLAPDTTTLKTNSDFLDLHLYSGSVAEDRKMWQTEEAQLGLFHRDAVPFVLVNFPLHNVVFDFPFNILRVQTDIRSAWFSSEKTFAKLILASYPQNLFYAMQMVNVKWAAELRQVARQGMERYQTAEAIDRHGAQIEARLTTAQMWQARWQASR